MPNVNINIYINQKGDIECLYNDLLLNASLGKLDIVRASTIEFDGESQQWVVYIIESGFCKSFPSRKEAVDWEVHFLESEMEK